MELSLPTALLAATLFTSIIMICIGRGFQVTTLRFVGIMFGVFAMIILNLGIFYGLNRGLISDLRPIYYSLLGYMIVLFILTQFLNFGFNNRWTLIANVAQSTIFLSIFLNCFFIIILHGGFH